jgi:GDP-4-dehydro-6-deoxy-D-mannose reductase
VDVAFELADAGSVRAAVEGAAPDVIFHLAAQAFVPASIRDPMATYDDNALGTARLYEALRGLGSRAPRVVLASSAEVYGARDPLDYPLQEVLAPQPATPYAASKAAAEAIALASRRTYGVPTIVTRAFNHIGPGQNAQFAVPAFATQIARVALGTAAIVKVGNLEAQRDFLDVRDVAAAYVALADRGVDGEIYNVCSGRPVALKDVLRRLITIAGVPVDVREEAARMRPSDVPVSYGDPSKLRGAAGWTPRFVLDRSLHDVYEEALARERVA